MKLLLLTVSSAWALMDCERAAPIDSLPRNGAEGVPVDVAPAMVFSSSLCGNEPARSAVLTRADDGTEVASVLEDEIDTDSLVEVFPDAPLDPLTPYVLTLNDNGPEVVVTFTTGEAASAGTEGRPVVEVRSASGFPRGDHIEVTAEAVPAGEEDSLVVFVDEEGVARGGGLSSLGEPVEADWLVLDGAVLEQVCVTAVQRNIAGERIESDPDCLGVVGACGCASTAGTPGLGAAFALVGAVSLLRRRAEPRPR